MIPLNTLVHKAQKESVALLVNRIMAEKNPEDRKKTLKRLTTIMETFFGDLFEKESFDKARKLIDEDGKWFQFLNRALDTLNPNVVRTAVMDLGFESGFYGLRTRDAAKAKYHCNIPWVNPFLTAKKLSLRARNLDGKPIKVNDKEGNPILIGLVVVWRLKDTYKALFDVDLQENAATQNVNSRMNALEKFVSIQSDAALRQVAGRYAYDNNEGSSDADEITLRSGGSEINEQLVGCLNERLSMAGIEVIEARINNLNYAPEIAAVMLRRQQASAVVSAREKIVEGAVTMVRMAWGSWRLSTSTKRLVICCRPSM